MNPSGLGNYNKALELKSSGTEPSLGGSNGVVFHSGYMSANFVTFLKGEQEILFDINCL